MGKTKNPTKPLTDAEIWDDSALVRTWDEAVEEYQLYHSIHATGENVEDALKGADAEEFGETGPEEEQHMETDGESPVVVPTAQAEHVSVSQESTGPQKPSTQSPMPGTGSGSGSAPMPHPAIASVQDEGLKSLMMSWYFAGYYTGLYEGQRKSTR